VKILRITPPQKSPQAVFFGIFAKKTVGTGIAKQVFRTGVDSACDLSSSTNRHPTEKNQKTLSNV
jgi:hypothetical protein